MTELESPEIAVVREFSGSVARMAKEILRIREDRLRSVATWAEELERVKAENAYWKEALRLSENTNRALTAALLAETARAAQEHP